MNEIDEMQLLFPYFNLEESKNLGLLIGWPFCQSANLFPTENKKQWSLHDQQKNSHCSPKHSDIKGTYRNMNMRQGKEEEKKETFP